MSALGFRGESAPALSRAVRASTKRYAQKVKIYAGEKFTDDATRAVKRAEKEATRLAHDYVGSEMLLLGLLSVNDSLAAKTLQEVGLSLAAARDQVETVIGRGNKSRLLTVFSGKKPFTQRAKNVLQNADDEAFRTKCEFVGSEHLLLALLREPGSTGVRVLELSGINPVRLERAIMLKIRLEKAASLEEARRIESRRPRKGKSSEGGMALAGGRGDQSHLTLKDFSTNITDMARAGHLDPLIGRNQEVERVTQILGRRRKNNAVLVGEPGVGKTAIAEGIASRIVAGEVPNTLVGKQIIELDMGMIVAGTKYRGEFEERLGNILREVEERNDVIIVIDEIHTLVGAGGTEGGADAANLLKPAMARGKLQLIGATTLEEYRKYIEKDAALERRFQPVMVPEPTVEECVDILHGLKGRYEEHHGCIFTDEAIQAAVYMSKRYVADRFLPDKAIDVLDEAGARERLRRDQELETDDTEMSNETEGLMKELDDLLKDKAMAVKTQNYIKAHELMLKEAELRTKVDLEMLKAKKGTKISKNKDAAEAEAEAEDKDKEGDEKSNEQKELTGPLYVTESDICQVIAAVSGVPVDKVTSSESSSLMHLEDDMREMMVGQHDAVGAISQAIRRARTGMRDPSRPIGSFIFAGPTGVGKSQLAKALTASYFGAEENMVRLDMSEYMEKHTVSKLIGSPPGYVGYDEGGGLTEKIRRSPYTLVLFDEVEKAHRDVFNLMLQILDDGRLTDAKGRTVDFKNTMIIMTTNIGSQVIMDQAKKAEEAGMTADEEVDEVAFQAMKAGVDDELKKFFRPEFLNRLDGIIVFHKLTKGNVREIAEIFLKKTYKRMDEQQVKLEITQAFKDRLVEMGYNPTYGARPLRRAMSTMIEDQLAEVSLRGEMKEGDTITMDMLNRDKIGIFNQEGDLLYTKDISAGNFGIS
jgi:ATP-dependent Clp protease ATP-binding subunit ClpC